MRQSRSSGSTCNPSKARGDIDVVTMDALLDTAPCGFVSFGDDGRIALINTTLTERLGYSRDELVGRHVEIFFPVSTKLFFHTHFYPLMKMHGRAREVFLLLCAKTGEELGALCNAVRHASDTP